MTNMVDRHTQGRVTGEGFVEAVEEKGVRELLIDQLLLLRAVVRGLSILTGIDLWEEEIDTDITE